MIVLWIALMIAGLVGIIVCQKKQKTNPNAQSIAFVFLIVILIGAGGMLYHTGIFGGDREMEKIMSNEIAYTKARSKVLADYIGKTWKGQSAVIIIEPNTDKNPIGKEALAAMEAGLKAAGMQVAAVEALNISQPSGNGDATPLEIAVTAKLYNDIFNKFKSAGVFVIMSQLPFETKELQKMACWKFDPKKARIVLVNGEIFKLKAAIGKGLIGAAIAMKTGPDAYDPEKAAPKDPQAAFDVRYILVTTGNVADIAAKNTELFAK